MAQDHDPPATGQPAGPEGREAQEDAQAPFRWTDAVLVFLGTAVLGNLLFLLLRATLDSPVADAAFVPLAGLLLLGLTVVYTQVRYGAARRLWGTGRPRWADVGIGAGSAVAAFILINLFLGLLLIGRDVPQVQEDIQQAALDPETMLIVLVGAVLVAPVAEEVFFRGLLFQALSRRLGLWPGIGLSSVVFALAHRQDSVEGTMLLFVAFFPFGMFLAWLFHRRRSLVGPIFCHGVFNVINFGWLFLIDRYGLS